MSSNELVNLSNVYSQDFLLVTGVLTAPVPNFYVGVSKILGLKLITATGAGAGTASVTQIECANAGAVGAHAVSVSVVSTNAADTSLYRLFWVNESLPGAVLKP